MDKDKLDGIYKRLHPATPKLTKKQIEVARENNAFAVLLKMIEKTLFLTKVMDGEIKPKERLNLFTDNWVRKEISDNLEKNEYLTNLLYSLSKNGERFSEELVTDDEIRYQLAALTSPHAGDCVCLPAECSRCSAETFFHIRTTVTWKQRDGRLMLEELCENNMWGVSDEDYFENKLENPENFKLTDLRD